MAIYKLHGTTHDLQLVLIFCRLYGSSLNHRIPLQIMRCTGKTQIVCTVWCNGYHRDHIRNLDYSVLIEILLPLSRIIFIYDGCGLGNHIKMAGSKDSEVANNFQCQVDKDEGLLLNITEQRTA